MSMSETARDPARAGLGLPLDADVLRLAHKLREVGRELDQRYLDKSELVRMLLITLRGRRAHADRRAARHRQVGAGAPPGAPDRRPLLRVSADPVLRAQRDLRPGRHQGVPRGQLRPPRRGHAARGGDRLPRRDLQVELRDPELAAQHPERAAVLHRQRQHQGAALLALRRDQRGAQRRRAGRDLRPVPGAHAVGEPGQLSLSRAGRARHPRRDRRDRGRRRRAGQAAGVAGRRSASCRRASGSSCSSPRSSSRATRASSSRSGPRA